MAGLQGGNFRPAFFIAKKEQMSVPVTLFLAY
jgi:hypothetical protein